MIQTISSENIDDQIAYIKEDLRIGIASYCQGFGCYSNDDLCKSDLDATRLLIKGRRHLDKFLSEIDSAELYSLTLEPTAIQTQKNEDNSEDRCILWSEISLSDLGKTLCVYGTVRRGWYSTQQEAYIVTFSSDSTALYFILYGNKDFEIIDGKCAKVLGKIDRVGETPVIFIPENGYIYKCE